MSLTTLKKDFLSMLDLKAEITMYNQMLLHNSNTLDKRNYNPEKCQKIKAKIADLQTEYDHLFNKWFNE